MQTNGREPWLLKKYENRRLYDTVESRYVTLEEVAERIRRGADPRIIDARSGADLTQATLAQIIIEGRGASRLLPVPLLLRLIRMEDDVLADFFGRFLIAALDLYQQAKQQAEAVATFNPFGFGPPSFGSADPWRFFRGAEPTRAPAAPPPPPPPPPAQSRFDEEAEEAEEKAAAAGRSDDLASLRRELEALKSRLVGRKRPKPKKK